MGRPHREEECIIVLLETGRYLCPIIVTVVKQTSWLWACNCLATLDLCLAASKWEPFR